MNYWDKLMESDEGAAVYMDSYGEGPGCETRKTISKFIKSGESVLDVGCGPGWNLDHFLEYGPLIDDYLGLDYSERFVRVANKRAMEKYDTEDNLFFEVGDVRDIQQPDGHWDVVLLQDVLEHTNGYEKPVKEALRVARKRVIVTFWRMHPGMVTKTNDDGDDGYGSEYNREEWETFLNDLPYHWTVIESSPEANRWHLFYIIDKEVV